jgi:hypothetical protein
MKYRIFIFILFLTPIVSAAQDSKQIKARKIKSASSKIEQLQKERTEVSFENSYYDYKGREIYVEYFNADSVCYKTERFEYNGKGRTVLHVIADSSQQKTTSLEQQYDQWNRLIEKVTTENSDVLERIVYTYNNFDDKTSESHFDKDGKLKKKTLYTYDKRGMLIHRTTQNGDGVITNDKTIQYIY